MGTRSGWLRVWTRRSDWRRAGNTGPRALIRPNIRTHEHDHQTAGMARHQDSDTGQVRPEKAECRVSEPESAIVCASVAMRQAKQSEWMDQRHRVIAKPSGCAHSLTPLVALAGEWRLALVFFVGFAEILRARVMTRWHHQYIA